MTSVITIDSRDVDWPPERIADAHERAAELIEQDGLENGDMWADGLVLMYRPGISCCLVGALAVACGFRHVIDVEQNFTGADFYDAQHHVDTRNPVHPVLAATLHYLGYTMAEQLMDWSDEHSDHEVAEQLRIIATELRRAGAA